MDKMDIVAAVEALKAQKSVECAESGEVCNSYKREDALMVKCVGSNGTMIMDINKFTMQYRARNFKLSSKPVDNTPPAAPKAPA